MFRIGMVRMVDWVISEEESLLGEGVDTLARNGLAITSHSREVCSLPTAESMHFCNIHRFQFQHILRCITIVFFILCRRSFSTQHAGFC